MAGIDIAYNSVDIQTDNIFVEKVSHNSIPDKDISIHKLARRNKSIITDVRQQTRTITIRGQIIGSSLSDRDQRVDDFARDMSPSAEYANLDIAYISGTRRYVATVQSLSIEHTDALFSAKFTIQFVCAQPFGVATSSNTLVNGATITASPSNQSLTILGNSNEQFLNISYTLNSFTGTANETITLKNNTTSQQITITRTWVAGEVLTIDVDNQTVKVDGVEVDYGGVFPIFKPGSHTLVVSDNWSARNVTFTVTQLARFN